MRTKDNYTLEHETNSALIYVKYEASEEKQHALLMSHFGYKRGGILISSG